MKILIIDDDVLLRRTVARILVADGHDVVTAPDGSRGIALFHQERPQMVITDIVMPGQEGIETIIALRRTDTPVKIIAISGHDAEMLETARLIGADDTIEKPFRAHELVSRVRALGEAPIALP
jgi:DNA-binding response OmpR family regulator